MSESAKPIAVKPPEVKKLTVLEQIKKLDEQKAKLMGDAKAELVGKTEALVAELNELGFDYQLVEGSAPKAKKTGTRNTDPTKKHCALCDMFGHDQRAHRSQGDKKRKFNAKELEELGLS